MSGERLSEVTLRVRAMAHHALSVYERFEWFLSELQGSEREDVARLARALEEQASGPAQQERVLVLLALHEDARAGEVLARWSPARHDQVGRAFRRLALRHRAWREGAQGEEEFLESSISSRRRGIMLSA